MSLALRDQADESKYLKMLGSSVSLSSVITQHYEKNTLRKIERSGSWRGEKYSGEELLKIYRTLLLA